MHYLHILWRVKEVLADINGGIRPRDVYAGMVLDDPPLGYTSGGRVELKNELEYEFGEEGLVLDRENVLSYQLVRDIADDIDHILNEE